MKIYTHIEDSASDQYTLDTLNRLIGKDLWVRCVLYDDLDTWVSPDYRYLGPDEIPIYECYVCTARHLQSYPTNLDFVRSICRRHIEMISSDEIKVISPVQVVTDKELFTEGANLI